MFGTGCGFNMVKTKLYSIDENYLETVDTTKYYMPTEIVGNQDTK
jgi:hypothetical protein